MRSSSASAPTAELPDGVYDLVEGGEDLPEGVVTRRATGVTRGFGNTSAIRPSLTEVYQAGSRVAGKYELIRKLGEGGMGAVWVAKNLTLDVHVALKLLRPGLSDDVPGAAERMQQEARAAAQIAHPGIIQVFDFGQSEHGVPFIAMELLNGESLASLLVRKKKLKPTRAVQTLLPIMDALAIAHERGIVHRDLKPDNVFLTRQHDGRMQPKVLDFGIAKFEQKIAPKLTQEGTVLGSPAYMAPEQARGEGEIDARADIWALGVALYETVTGVCPFTAQNYQALLWAILGTEPEPLERHGLDEPELGAIIARCLSKQRNDRYQDVRALGGALAAYLAARGVTEDIAKGSLGAWLNPRVAGAEPLLSMFPSSATPDTIRSRTHANSPATPEPPLVLEIRAEQAPRDPLPEQATRVSEDRVGLFGPVSSEQTPLDAAAHARARTTVTRARPMAPWRHPSALWIGLAAFGAAVAFTVAALRSPSGEGDAHEAAAAHDAERPATPASPPARATTVAATKPAPESESEADLGAEPVSAPDAAAVRAARAAPKPPLRPNTRPPRERKPSRPEELKNPFADGRSEGAADVRGGATRTQSKSNTRAGLGTPAAKVKAQ